MPYDTNPAPPLAAQSAALHALANIADAHPELPGAYVVSHSIHPEQIDVQFNNPRDLEKWRASLGITPDTVSFMYYADRRHLEFFAPVGTTLLRVYAVFPDVSATPKGSQA